MSLIDRFFGSRKTKRSMLTKLYHTAPENDFVRRERLDTASIRNIWNNVHPDYKLSASVVICGIKAICDYIGVPEVKISGVNKKMSRVIMQAMKDAYHTVNRKALTEGNFFIWSNYNSTKNQLEHIFFNYEDMKTPFFDIDTKELVSIIFDQEIKFLDKLAQEHSTHRVMTFNPTQIITEYVGDIPDGSVAKATFTHNYGRIPLVYWTYGKGDDEMEGHGLIEPCEPYLGVLHEVMLNRAIEDKRSSRKKYNITAQDPEDWIKNTKTMNGIPDETQEINIEDIEIFFSQISETGSKEEKVAYLNPGQNAADSIQIAKLAFMNIIEILRTPEWIYPPKLGASFASASVQVPAFIQLIDSTREELSKSWREQISVDAMVMRKATMQIEEAAIEISWQRLTLESYELRSKIILYIMNSMKIAKDECLMDDEEIRAYIDSFMGQLKDMKQFEAGREKMLKDLEGVKKAFAPKDPVNAAQGSPIGNETATQPKPKS